MPDGANAVDYDAIGATVADASQSVADAQTDTLSQVVEDSVSRLEVQLDTMSYEQQVTMQTLAQDTAAATVETLMQSQGESQEEGEAQAQAVTLDAAQWQYVQQSLQMANTSLVLSLLMTCAVLGALLADMLVRGWRH